MFVFSFPGRAPAIMKVSEYLSKIRVRFKTTARPLLLMAALLLTLPHRPSLAQGTTTDCQNLPLHFPEPRETVGFVDSIPHFRLRHPSSTSKQMNAFVFSDGQKLFFFKKFITKEKEHGRHKFRRIHFGAIQSSHDGRHSRCLSDALFRRFFHSDNHFQSVTMCMCFM